MRCTPCEGGWNCVCPCGYSIQAQAGTAYHVCSTSTQPPKLGLGDMVAAGLATVGITKERVSKALGRDCGCAKRQAALNEFGKRLGIGNADAGPPLPPQR